jgi:hypothetical protein
LLYALRPYARPFREVPHRQPYRPKGHLIQFALGWAVAPELRATVRLTARFRSAVLRNLIRAKTGGATSAWSNSSDEIRHAVTEMIGKDLRGQPLQGPRRHAEFPALEARG